jgi:hypothetical protein
MADKKISALPASTTPLAGTEVLPIVQSGATKQVSVANLTAGRAISATSVTASTGNFVVGTSGQGIDFSATPGTGTSELFADYEEGTWTPGQGDLTLSAGTFVSSGTYTKIGRTVYFTYILTTNSPGTQTVSIVASGATALNLPFAEATSGTSTAYDYSSVGVATQVASSRVYFYTAVALRGQITGGGVYSV